MTEPNELLDYMRADLAVNKQARIELVGCLETMLRQWRDESASAAFVTLNTVGRDLVHKYGGKHA